MSVLGMVGRNRIPQIKSRGVRDDVDDRWTPSDLWERLDTEHHFSIDVAASHANHKTPRYYTRTTNGLAQSWANETVWCNPPYSGIAPWVAKALHEVLHGCHKVVLLLPANRTEQPWWQDMIEPVRDRAGSGVATTFLRARTRFFSPSGARSTSPPFGCAIVIITPPEQP